MNNLLKILIFILGFGTFNIAQAARPMMTDDARIVDPKACQLESWVRDSKHMTEYWAQPGCNVGENTEITIGGSLEGENGHSSFANEIYQIKSIIRPIDINQTTGLYAFGAGSKSAPVLAYSGLYCINEVASKFSGGVFKQVLTGFRRPQQEKLFDDPPDKLFNTRRTEEPPNDPDPGYDS